MSIYSEILEKLKTIDIEEVVSQIENEEVFYQLSDMRKNLLVWYEFKKNASILEIGGECGGLTGLLCDKAKSVTSFEPNKEKAEINGFINADKKNLKIISENLLDMEESYDYIVIVGALETASQFIDSETPYKDLLRFAKSHLKEDGIILLATNNRLGVRYFAGAPEAHLETYFTGINDYRGINDVRTFSKNELKELYISAGLFSRSMYYPYPDYRFPSEIFTDRTINTNLYGRPYPNYDKKYVDIIDENKLLQDYAKEGIAGSFANSFFVELTFGNKNKKSTDIEYVKISSDRKKQFQIYTTIWTDESGKMVSKYPYTKDSKKHVESMKSVKFEGSNYSILKDSSKKSDVLSYEFLNHPSLDIKANGLIQRKKGDGIIELFDFVKDSFLSDDKLKVMNPSENQRFVEVFGEIKEDKYKCVSNVCFDLILDNIFEVDNKLIIIDYEWFFDFFIPSEYLLWRSINELFYKYPELYNLINRTELLQRYDITQEREEEFRKWEAHFINDYVGGGRFSDHSKEKLNIRINEESNLSFSRKYPVSTLFADYGEGFSEENKTEKPLSIDENGNFEISFCIDVEREVNNLRWDPLEASCVCRDIKATIDGEEVECIPIDSAQEEAAERFLTNDPFYIVNMDGRKVSEIKISGNIVILDDDTYFDEVRGAVANYKSVINQKNETIYHKDLTINEKNDELFRKDEEQYEREVEYTRNLDALTDDFTKQRNEYQNLYQTEINRLSNEVSRLSTDVNKCNEEILMKDRELNASQAYIDSIRNSKLWNAYRVKRGTKRLIKGLLGKNTFKVENNTDNLKYAIEGYSYEDGVLSIGGWIFSPFNKIDKLFVVVIKDEEEQEVEVKNRGIRREDIKVAFNHEAAYDSGFNDRFILRLNGKAEVVLKALVGKKEYYLRVGKIEGNIPCSEIILDNYIEIEDGESFVGQSEVIVKGDHTDYNFDETIDVIIPIYNGLDYLKKLLVDIRKTKIKSHIILVDDKSPDENVLPLLKEYAEKYDNVELLCNEENLGFVKTVNKGLSVSNNHAVLVNTDVELPEGWLERLMYPIVKFKNIASTTPFANSATIFSFPNFAENNPIYRNMSVENIDAYFKEYKPRYTVVPTGMGFLMGMNRDAINEIGVLDEESFGKGFGEENDWCQRAAKKHYFNIHVENLFAYHKHGGSFVSEEKQRLLDENLKKLGEKHPNYFADVARFCEKNPLDEFRKIIKLRIDCEAKGVKSIVVFNHDLGGGADSYLKQRINEWTNNNDIVFEVKYKVFDGDYEVTIYNGEVTSKRFISLEDSLSYINYFKIDEIIINELVTFPRLFDVLNTVKDLAKEKNIKLTMLMHDYFAISPTINLISTKNYNYSFNGKEFDCDKYYHADGYDQQYDCPSIAEWRSRWQEFLLDCDEVRAFSGDTMGILKDIYPGLKNVTLVPHKVEYMLPVRRKRKLTNTMNIGLLGVLSRHKGKDIVSTLIQTAEHQNENLRFVLVGMDDPSDPNPIEESEYFRKTGRYNVEDLPKIVLENDIDMFLIPSIWPETFSYTTEEIMKMELPVSCFDFGAPAERVKKYDKGLILESKNPKGIIKSLVEFGEKLKIYDEIREESRKVLCIAEYISFSSRYRMEHFQEQLLLEGIESRYCGVEDLDKITDEELAEYSHIFIYRCRYMDNLVPFIDRVKGIKPIIYDIDDYIYDYARIKEMKFLKDDEYSDFENYSGLIKKCIDKADVLTTSTNTLADVLRKDFSDKKVIVSRNVASISMYILSQKAILSNEYHEGTVLGYFSGSKTHNEDFELIEDSLINLLKTHDDYRLLLVGCLELSDKFDEVKDKIVKKDFVDWRKLPELLRSVDINLMPLVDNFFNCCKSENKWTEAALVKRITVASYNEEIAAVSKSGENIIICNEAKEWSAVIEKIAKNKDSIVENAFKYIYENKLTCSSSKIVYEILG